MARKEIVLPNPVSYIDYINEVLIDSFINNIPTESQVEPTTTIARILSDGNEFILVEKEEV